ncbi:MAG: DUF4364 family protein, partial [Clostridioides sp.]|nr:DUF4364 family protein [Clostridioides sp.]
MFESTPEQLAYHKLLILYTLKKIEQGLTGWQLNQVLLEKDLMNYFSIQTNLNQLIESKLVKLYTKSEIDYYALTQLGLETLESFMNRIPEDIRQLIDDYIDDNEYNWLSESYLKAESEYIRKNDQE